MINLDDYDGPPPAPPQRCTCAGTDPGYPMHEPGCGELEIEPEDGEEARCEQCGTITGELYDSDPYGLLCSRCAYRQVEHDQPGHGLSASTFGFLSETE